MTITIMYPILICLLVVKLSRCSVETPMAFTNYGPIRGSTGFSRNNREFSSYRGIPYAKPPIDELRFKAPELPQPWSNLNATSEGPYCIQKNYFFANPRVEGQEDCLYLNVYVPKVSINAPLPVLVFIHWGDFFAGRGTSDYLGPEYLMDKDVILVTFNYRLGVFGFFSTLDDSAPGNFGMKDQVMALKFIRENIHHFGGDPGRVTISGQSAGAGSVGLHLVSPLSKGLFQQAISQSGSGLSLWVTPFDFLQPGVVASLGNFSGCGYFGDNEKLVDCLRRVNAEDLAETADKFKYFSIEPLTPYWIVVEKPTKKNPNPFLTKPPIKYWQNGEFMKVPYILGTVQDEGILRVAPLTRQPDTIKALNSNFQTLITAMFGLALSSGPNNTIALYQNLIDFYLDGKEMIDVNDPRSVQGFIDMYSDRTFVYSVYQSAIWQSQMGHSPIWMYNFDYRGQYSYGDLFAATNANINFTWGVSHCDDLLYLYKSPALFHDLQENDLLMSEIMLDLWTNFVIYGNPDYENRVGWHCLNLRWPEDLHFLNITGCSGQITLHPQNGFLPRRMNFWATQNLTENYRALR